MPQTSCQNMQYLVLRPLLMQSWTAAMAAVVLCGSHHRCPGPCYSHHEHHAGCYCHCPGPSYSHHLHHASCYCYRTCHHAGLPRTPSDHGLWPRRRLSSAPLAHRPVRVGLVRRPGMELEWGPWVGCPGAQSGVGAGAALGHPPGATQRPAPADRQVESVLVGQSVLVCRGYTACSSIACTGMLLLVAF